MFKNVATKIALFAFDTTSGAAKTGDAANLTAYVAKDYGTVTVLGDTSATEMDATNAKGWYLFDVAQAETNADALLFTGKSSTANIAIVGQHIFTTPNRFSTLVIDAAGLADANAVKIGPTGAGTAQTARDIGASVLLSSGAGTGQLDFTSGVVKANATQWLGGTIPAVNVTGVPLIDLKYTLGTISPATAGSVRADEVTGAVGSVTGAVGSVTARVTANADQLAGQVITAAAGVTFPSTVASPTNITAGTIATVTNLTNAPTVGDLTAAMQASVANAVLDAALSGHAIAGSAGAGISSAATAGDPWSTSLPGAYGAGTAGKIVGDNLDATVGSRTKPADTQAAVTSVGDKTGYRLSATGVNDLLRTALTEGYAADGAQFTLEQAIYMLWALLAERGIAGTVLTAKKLDGSTDAMTFTLDDATTPTAQTRAT